MTQDPPTINAESELVARLRDWPVAMRGQVLRGLPDRLERDLSEAAAIIERLASAHETLFDAIKHGDEVHRDWLREAIANHFSGKPVPPPRAANPSAREQGRREGIEMAGARLDQEAKWYEDRISNYTNEKTRESFRAAATDYETAATIVRAISPAPPPEKDS